MKWTANFLTQLKIADDQTTALFRIILEDSALTGDCRDDVLLGESIFNHTPDGVNAYTIFGR